MGDNQGADNGRRDLIKKGAVIGALAWVAPTIVSVPAASAATVPPFEIILGQSGAEAPHDLWNAIMVVDLNTSYTNLTGVDQLITTGVFSFTAGTGAATVGSQVRPFIVLESTGDVLAIGSTKNGPFNAGQTYSNSFGAGPFTIPAGETIRLGARTLSTSGGAPIGYTATGSSSLTGGPNAANTGSLPGVGQPPTPGTNPFTTFGRTYQMRASFNTV